MPLFVWFRIKGIFFFSVRFQRDIHIFLFQQLADFILIICFVRRKIFYAIHVAGDEFGGNFGIMHCPAVIRKSIGYSNSLQSKCILVVIPPQLPPISRGCPCDANLRHYDGLSHGGIKHSGVSLNFFAEMTKYFFKNSFGAPAKKPAINTVPFSIFFRDLLPTHVSFHYIKNYAYKDFVIKFFVASREWQKMLESIK